jgi:hypothetical protein
LRIAGLSALLLAAGIAAASAQEMQSPRISRADVDWNAVAAELKNIEALKEAPDALQDLNQTSAALFPAIAASPVPVLLPFDTASYLRDRAAKVLGKSPEDYLEGFQASPFFFPGPSGYDAAFTLGPREKSELGIRFSERIDVHMSGSALLYELDEPTGMIGTPVKHLEAAFPGIRRLFLENNVRYTFVRYGVPYVVSLSCFEGGARYRRMSCRDADKVAVHFLQALRVAGGAAQTQAPMAAPNTVERPQAQSTVFTYHPPGQIIPGTGFKRGAGRVDYTVYSKIRFPIADAPAFANSQSFMNWGDCDHTGRISAGRQGKTAAYRCRVSGQPLVMDESATANYSYPWRDNFCEHRYFAVGQCPGGLGHQGQDIRPSSCRQRVEGANRCEPYQHDVVAARDGVVLRMPGQMAAYVVVNAPGERVRFRYLHMFPKQLDQDGVISGRAVREGEVIGKVGNFNRRERGTTYHLHFDMQVPTKYGWVFVNPYMTLVAAYERMIHGRGREVREEAGPDVTQSVGATAGTPAAAPGQNTVQSESNVRIEATAASDDPPPP